MRRLFGVLLACLALAVLSPLGTAHAAGKNPVVFVHGYTGSASNWVAAQAYFRLQGYDSSQLHAFEYDWSQSNEISAAQLGDFIEQGRQETGADRGDIVNHPVGGRGTRGYREELGGRVGVGQWGPGGGARQG